MEQKLLSQTSIYAVVVASLKQVGKYENMQLCKYIYIYI